MSTRAFGQPVGAPASMPLIGDSPVMQELRRQIGRAARTSLSVLIEGPSGGGKELVAQALHFESGRKGRFVAFNVCAVADGMFEDALFGHVRGAYSGAMGDNPGYCEEANGGTLFLDEIGALGLAQQAKLLRVVETKTFRKVGARADQHSDFRLVTASNLSLERLAASSMFRDDLRHRLAGVVIRVPSLAEHREDIPTIAAHFATNAVAVGQVAPMFTTQATDYLQSCSWPGNIRELKSVIERTIAFATSSQIGARDVRAVLESAPPSTEVEVSTERRRIVDALMAYDWDTVRAASALGLNRSSLYRVIKRLGITRRAMVCSDSDLAPERNRTPKRRDEVMRILPHSPSFAANEGESPSAQEA
ncbi:MAG: sigma 54-interacting transcriptional regulator [Gemmatimonadota bacterium]|nr:sigma 54-interacting transcriptional regulator [Gemmatimonadota bacterium]